MDRGELNVVETFCTVVARWGAYIGKATQQLRSNKLPPVKERLSISDFMGAYGISQMGCGARVGAMSVIPFRDANPGAPTSKPL